MKYCPKCGTQIKQGSRFCSKCGTAFISHEIIKAEPAQEIPSKIQESSILPPKRLTKYKIITMVGVTIILLILLLILFGFALKNILLIKKQASSDFIFIGNQRWQNEKDGSIMIEIPAGEFIMGSNRGNLNEKPEHTVYLSAFYLDKYELTVGQFRRFCKATGWTMPNQPEWNQGDDLPMVNVTWAAASAYASWVGERLPTEAEWEKVARGTDKRKYPWGDELVITFCNSNLSRKYRTTKVGSYSQGASPYGVMDMAGNVSEWCEDWYDVNYFQNKPSRNPPGPSSGVYRVIRGGSWDSHEIDCRTTYREGREPQFMSNFNGFRCARDAK